MDVVVPFFYIADKLTDTLPPAVDNIYCDVFRILYNQSMDKEKV